ncbi:YeeE/YedE thiosulfate transporter family protein [Dendrosporobacter sp. 1207_IL3150]|uniref:YeeE/YedE thiosulfate transporter family protein n=1 Tax=Dendrosporobacter sp. 1207_IL3150 TaxID=3084054 RepID=UPI002FDAAA7E
MRETGGWNPYIAGILSGFVSIGSVWFVGKYFGASTTFVRTTGMLEKLVAPERIASMPYFIKEVPIIDWQWMFVIGILIGSFIAAVSSGSFRLQAVPSMWKERFGAAIFPRATVAFIGGMIAMFGARLADGCPSGHGLSGVTQLAVSGFVALVCFFVGGLISANLLYKGGGKS